MGFLSPDRGIIWGTQVKPKRPTSYQVAELAGVSRTTVSFVLNNVDGINLPSSTRQRVLDAAKELGYVPDAAARKLASGRTQTIGLLLHGAFQLEIDAYIPQVLSSLFTVSQKHGFQVIVETVTGLRQTRAYRDLVRGKQIDGLVVFYPNEDDEELIDLIDEGFPAVLLGSVGHPNEHYVVQRSSIRPVMQHLIGLGHERIAHITFAPEELSTSSRRLASYRRYLQEANLEVSDELVRFGEYSAESGYYAMNSLLRDKVKFSALFAGNDTIALGAMAALHEAGLSIPEEVAVVGYDDIPNARFSTPPLTTVRTPPLEQGRLAGEMLIDLITGKSIPEPKIRLDTKLIIRNSCGGKRVPSS
ncbi:MAG: LacI family DNA-binding transcriptional regulator [Trueperaceae bacterium]|nr:LacI family DNA-binding transcriptional regulator [Trueperaceae bacterium]